MKLAVLSLIPFLAGVGIAFQSSMSGQLGKILANPIFATFVIYTIGALLTGIILWLHPEELPRLDRMKIVPVHLWFLGSILSVIALISIYAIMPIVGIPKTMAAVIVGQVLISLLIGHMGWFDMPVTTISMKKGIGALFLLVGVGLINL